MDRSLATDHAGADHPMLDELVERIRMHLNCGVDPMLDTVMEHPVDRYVRQDVLDGEQADLFHGHPLVVGHSDRVRQPGDFFTDDLTGTPLLVVRGDDGILRAFHNSCGHRGTKVELRSCGNRQRFTCPFHAWNYDRSGALRSLPYSDGFDGVDLTTRGLVEIPVAERHGLVWIQPGLPVGAAVEVADYLGGLDAELAAFGIEAHHHDRTDHLEQPFNWKFVIDGFLETYHLKFLHRDTVGPYIRSNFAMVDSYGPHGRMVGLRKGFEEQLAAGASPPELLPYILIVYLVFPNTIVVWQNDHFETWTAHPADNQPDRTVARATLLTPGPVETAAESAHWDKNWAILMSTVVEEDFAMSRIMQGTFTNGSRSHAIFGRQEALLQHFHDTIGTKVPLPTKRTPSA